MQLSTAANRRAPQSLAARAARAAREDRIPLSVRQPPRIHPAMPTGEAAPPRGSSRGLPTHFVRERPAAQTPRRCSSAVTRRAGCGSCATSISSCEQRRHCLGAVAVSSERRRSRGDLIASLNVAGAWSVAAAGCSRSEVDDGGGFRAATGAKVDAALWQRELFRAAEYPVRRAQPDDRDRRRRVTALEGLETHRQD